MTLITDIRKALEKGNPDCSTCSGKGHHNFQGTIIACLACHGDQKLTAFYSFAGSLFGAHQIEAARKRGRRFTPKP